MQSNNRKISTAKPILVTGVAGFIGFHLARQLLADEYSVIGIDNLNDYYDVNLKKSRLALLQKNPQFTFQPLDIAQRDEMRRWFGTHSFDVVLHMAAQAGVRYSLENPHAYIDSNLVGFTNILEGCRHSQVGHLVFASSSSVYGSNTKMPFSVDDNVDHPVSLYAATKKANELMAHSYAHLYGLPCTGLRFFTVYGPWGRPDMAMYIFAQAISEGRPIEVYNHGDMQRDFTYVDDVVEGVLRVAAQIPQGDKNWDSAHPAPGSSYAPYRIYNIGNHSPVRLMDLIHTLEQAIGKKADKKMLPLQLGDVPATYADVDSLIQAVDFYPRTPIDEGVARFVNWFKEYHKIG